MKLKNIERTANVAWSPRAQYPVYLACGTAAQQLDASFSTSAALEVYLFNPDVSGLECELVASAETPHRFNKVRLCIFEMFCPRQFLSDLNTEPM